MVYLRFGGQVADRRSSQLAESAGAHIKGRVSDAANADCDAVRRQFALEPTRIASRATKRDQSRSLDAVVEKRDRRDFRQQLA